MGTTSHFFASHLPGLRMSSLRVLVVACVSLCCVWPLLGDDVVSTGKSRPELQPFDQVMIDFLKQHELPGAALAIGRQGKLIYARGYGLADVDARQPVQPESLFRIASISKPITAVAILKLVQEQRLKLDDKAFSFVKLAPHLDDGVEPDARLADITIRQLLQHTGGWDRDKSFDPMFFSVKFAKALDVAPPAQPEHVIRYMMGQPLDFAPGERYAYSNFGYCVLGRIIEAVTKQPYEKYVQAEILKPLSITTMRVGRTRLAGRLENEVRYYSKKPLTGASVFAEDLGTQVPNPYGAWYLEAMDSHGGWIASAPDLVKFIMTFDQSSPQHLLNDETFQLMIERPTGRAGHKADGQLLDVYYGLGWLVRPHLEGTTVNIWHNGSLPGTSTILVHRQKLDLSWAVLFNSRDADPAPSGQIEPLLHEATKKIKEWPSSLDE